MHGPSPAPPQSSLPHLRRCQSPRIDSEKYYSRPAAPPSHYFPFRQPLRSARMEIAAISPTAKFLLSSADNHRSLPRFSSPLHRNTSTFFCLASLRQNGMHATNFRNLNSLQLCSAAATSSSSVSEEVPPENTSVSFLDRKETGILHFVKYHGLGNDFILVDNRDSVVPKITSEQAVQLCDRNFGIGADGVIFALPGINGTHYTMRIYNSDGSEPEMCGNGIRCLARFISELENLQGKKSYSIHTGAGLIVPEIQEDGQVRVDMGEPILKASDVPTKLQPNKDQSIVKSKLDVDGISWNVTCVSMGNPHCVTFGSDFSKNLEVDELNLAEIGPKFEYHVMFPARTNTEFVQVLSPTHLKMRVWERGAGATLACGTGACAVVVAAVLEDRAERTCTVDLPGGPLHIEWREENNHVYMTGPAEVVFYGSVPL